MRAIHASPMSGTMFLNVNNGPGTAPVSHFKSLVRSEFSYYQTLSKYIHAHIPNAVIWLNPGSFPEPSFMSIANVVMVPRLCAGSAVPARAGSAVPGIRAGAWPGLGGAE